MSVIYLNLKFEGSLGEASLETLFDSGASYSFINEKSARGLGILEKLRKPWEFETAEQGRKLLIKETIRLDFFIDGIHLSDEFLVSETVTEAVIIGSSTMQKWRMHLDFENDKVIVDKKASRLILK